MLNIEGIIAELKNYQGPPLKLMEVCGTHTSAIMQLGIRSLISPKITLVSGPGCPVCVTPAAFIDAAVAIAQEPGYTVLSFGDMFKVPGSGPSLSESKGEGASVEMIYSPREVLVKAEQKSNKIFVVAAVGFETTLPAYCDLLQELEQREIRNVRLLTSLRQIIPALSWLGANSPEIDGYILPGHVSVILGQDSYQPLALELQTPMAIAGFSAEHILLAIYDLVKQVQSKKHQVHNLYPSVVSRTGNTLIQEQMERYFRKGQVAWRGLGSIDASGLFLRDEYTQFNMPYDWPDPNETAGDVQDSCLCGEVLLGRISPPECPSFRTFCTPSTPQGPCMISLEGACGIWYRFHKEK